MRVLSIGLLLAALLGSAIPARAQAPGRPPNSTRGLFGGQAPEDPNRSTQKLESTVDIGAGYDSNLLSHVPTDPTGSRLSGFGTTASGLMRYWRGRTVRFVEASGRAYVNYQSLAEDEFIGGEASILGMTSLGRRSGLMLDVGAEYDPAVVMSALATPIDSDTIGGVPEESSVPPVGIPDERRLGAHGSVSLHRMLTSRQRLEVQYSMHRVRPLSGEGLDSDSRLALLSHTWTFSERLRLRSQYRYDTNRQEGLGTTVFPLTAHTAETGLEYERRLSPSRNLRIGARAGASYIPNVATATAVQDDATLPVLGGSLGVDLARNWQVIASAQRAPSVLAGVTQEPFLSDEAALNIDGIIANRLSVGVGGTYARGSGVDQESSRFDAITGSASIRYRISNCCSAFSSYGYYRHNLRELATASTTFPAFFDNHAVRAGFTLWLPLYGVF